MDDMELLLERLERLAIVLDELMPQCAKLVRDAITLLKEQEERGKRICKEICDFIHGSCSTDTDADKEYVCHVIQEMFIKGWR